MATVTEIKMEIYPRIQLGDTAAGARGYKGFFQLNKKGRGQKVFIGNSEAAVRAAAVAYGESLDD